LTYAVRILLVAEFNPCSKNFAACANVLKNVEADPSETWWYWLVLGALFASFRLLALHVLRQKATKFF
jgi:hypothetical protein